MLIVSEIIAKKYGLAFFRTHQQRMTTTTVEQLTAFKEFFESHTYFLNCLSMPSLRGQKQVVLLQKIAARYNLENFLHTLTVLIVQHNRIQLFPTIIKYIIFWYQKAHKISEFTVRSSHRLQEHEKQQIIAFIHRMVASETINAHFNIDTKLIYGLSITSDTLRWERSLQKTLQQVQQSMFRQVGL